MLDLLLQGFATCLQPENLVFVFIGVLIGQIVGALPGVGPAAGMALLLPLTFGLEPVTAVMMLAGIMYGGQYGGTLTSVLINVPGEASGVMTAVDGHQMAQAGRAGAALSIAAIGSFIAGIGSVAAVAFVTPALSGFALRFNAPEYFLLALLGIIATASLGTSPIRAMMAGVLGLMIALVGSDPLTGAPRLTFGQPALFEGIDFIPVAIGVFGIAEVLASLERAQYAQPIRTRLRDMWLTADEWAQSWRAIPRGGVIGLFVGIMPGAGASVASLLAYLTERRFSRSARALRQRRDRRGGSGKVGQQRRFARRDHSNARARHPRLGQHRRAPGGPDPAWNPARSDADDSRGDACLGADRQHVRRQRHAPRSSTCRSRRCSPRCCVFPTSIWRPASSRSRWSEPIPRPSTWARSGSAWPSACSAG